MVLIKYLFIILLSISLNADTILNRVYYVETNDIKLNTIVQQANPETIIFKIPSNKHTKKVKSKELLKILNSYGYKDYKYKTNFISFIKKSPIDTTIIKIKLQEYYQKKYKIIDIHSIDIEPRSYMTSLPDDFIVETKSKNYLKKDGILSIKTKDRKKVFFNYMIDAHVDIYVSRKKINKKEELSAINSTKKSIILDNFKAKPIQEIDRNSLQAKHNISKDKILTIRDAQALSLVRKGSQVNVSFTRDNINISFSAQAIDDGKLGQTIRVQKTNGKKIKVKVTGKNKAEII